MGWDAGNEPDQQMAADYKMSRGILQWQKFYRPVWRELEMRSLELFSSPHAAV